MIWTAWRHGWRHADLNWIQCNFRNWKHSAKLFRHAPQELQAKRNSLSKLIGQAKAKGEDVSTIMADVVNLEADEHKQLKRSWNEVQYRS